MKTVKEIADTIVVTNAGTKDQYGALCTLLREWINEVAATVQDNIWDNIIVPTTENVADSGIIVQLYKDINEEIESIKEGLWER